MTEFPASQQAVQLVGPDKLELNANKAVPKPTGHQILAKIEATGLCFSDLKLLKQFSGHVRKGPVVGGVAEDILEGLASYVPGEQPTVPGHECVCRIVAVGDDVERHAVGDRCIVQADWREVLTAESNAAFGYNFEGALQQYALLDERLVIEPSTDEKYLIEVNDDRSASAVALVEPWACVECSYASPERNTVKPFGKLLVVAEDGHDPASIDAAINTADGPEEIVAIYVNHEHRETLSFPGEGMTLIQTEDPDDELASLPDETFDDIIYFGARPERIETLNDKLGRGGIMNVVLGGESIGRPVEIGVGRVHYGLTRWIGTTGSDAGASYRHIPPTGELRKDESVVVIGAGGPMGQMHVIRNLSTDIEGVSVTATDFDQPRLDALAAKVAPLAEANNCPLKTANPKTDDVSQPFSYYAIMAPVGSLVAQAVDEGDEGAIINIFAGIPATVKQAIDLDRYIANGMFMFGTSGSRIDDMRIVRDKVQAGQLDTDLSVDAVCGMAGAVEGIRAVENREMAGKIVVYPELVDLPLIPLEDLADRYPAVAEKLSNGCWCKEAEAELLKLAAKG
jgi:D-arabinose 1-dehydrogenase-like Zn-dependent alcohol dehydrogenase